MRGTPREKLLNFRTGCWGINPRGVCKAEKKEANNLTYFYNIANWSSPTVKNFLHLTERAEVFGSCINTLVDKEIGGGNILSL